MKEEKKEIQTAAFTATDAQLATWKKEHGGVHRIIVKPDAKDPSLDRAAYLMKPKRQHFSLLNEVAGSEFIARQGELLRTLWLDGDMDIQIDDDYFLNAISVLNELVPSFEVALEKK